jgi:hypothetical protein
MSLFAILDVAIVLTAVYVTLSCVVSWVHEQIATVLRLRGKMLYDGILNLVFGHPEIVERIFSHPLITTGVRTTGGVKAAAPGVPAASAAAATPPAVPAPADAAAPSAPDTVVATIGNALRAAAAYRPSYIDARNFSVAFWQSVSETQNARISDVGSLLAETPATLLEDLKDPVNALVGPYPNLHKTCLALIAQAEGDYQKLLATTDGWFNAQMDRVSGWYKRQTQFIIIFLSLLVVAFTGIDSIEVAKRLYIDPELRNAVVQPIVQTVQNVQAAQPSPPPPAASAPPAADTRAASAARSTAVAQTMDQVLQTTSFADLVHLSLNPFANWPQHAVGMFVTFIALSAGAPFWFDVLNLFVNVRAEGRAPQRTDQPPQ